MKLSETLLHIALQNYVDTATPQQKKILTEAVASLTSCSPLLTPNSPIDVMVQKISPKEWAKFLAALEEAKRNNGEKGTIDPQQCLTALIDKIKVHLSTLTKK